MPDAPSWLANAFGIAAGLCSMASFVPQIIKMLKERDASSVSLRMYAVTTIGFCCWVAYGLLSNSWPVAVANAVCLCLVIVILILRLRFGGQRG